MKCIKGKEIQVLRSNAGYYIGCFDVDGPYCRISHYYRDKATAEAALKNKTFFRDAEEISFCNRGCGCIPDPT